MDRRERGSTLVFRRLRGIFGQGEPHGEGSSSGLFGLDETERERIGTEDDPLRGFEAAMERHAEAARAEQTGDPEKAIRLYEISVSEGFVGSHPYERLCYAACTVVRVNDLGPYVGGRDLDLSAVAAEEIGLTAAGADVVDVRVLE
jgi:hypothetical protein